MKKILTLDLRSLAFFRISLGLIIIYDLMVSFYDFEAHYTDVGAIPRDLLINHYLSPDFFSLYFMSGESWFVFLLFAFAFILAAMMIIGYRTRLVTILSWVFLVSIQNRNPVVLIGADCLLRLLLFWAIFLPIGAKYSVDNALSYLKSKKNQITSVVALAVPLQMSLLYFSNYFFKSDISWYNGEAVRDALLIDQWTKPLGYFLLQFPWVTKTLTYFTIVVEFLAAFFILSPFKNYFFRAVASFFLIFFHLGLFFAMELGTFSFVAMAGLICLIPPPVWDFLQRKLSPKETIIIYYDKGCELCKKSCYLIREFFLVQAEVKIVNEDKISAGMKKNSSSWLVQDSKGRSYTKFKAFFIALKNSSLPFLAFPFKFNLFLKLGNFFYGLLTKIFSKVNLGAIFFRKPEKISLKNSLFVNTLATFFLVLVVWWNAIAFSTKVPILPYPLEKIVLTLRLDQVWNMFSPKPSTVDGWYIIQGHLVNGDEVDVYNKKNKPVTFKRPDSLAKTFKSLKWNKFLNRMEEGATYYLYSYARYICRDWNKNIEDHNKKLENFKMFYMFEETINGKNSKPKETVVIEHHCYI